MTGAVAVVSYFGSGCCLHLCESVFLLDGYLFLESLPLVLRRGLAIRIIRLTVAAMRLLSPLLSRDSFNTAPIADFLTAFTLHPPEQKLLEAELHRNKGFLLIKPWSAFFFFEIMQSRHKMLV